MHLTKHRVHSVADRVRLIEGQVRKSVYGAELFELRRFVARDVLRDAPARDDAAAVQAIFNWTRQHIRYEPDPIGLDLYPTARAVVSLGVGDCDCHTILNCSMLAVIGFEVGCRVIEDSVRGWHVYALAGSPRVDPVIWVPLDTAWSGSTGVGDEFPLHNPVTDNQTWFFELEG